MADPAWLVVVIVVDIIYCHYYVSYIMTLTLIITVSSLEIYEVGHLQN